VARVVTESPRPLVAQRHTIPRHVEAAALTALEKLPADRFATAAEFAEALRDKSYASTVSLEATPSGRPGAKGLHPARTIVALGAALAIATAAALWGWLRPAPPGPLSQFSLSLRADQMLQPPNPGGGGRLALSPDGRTLVYVGPGVGGPQLWLRRLDQLDATPIAGTVGASNPFFSPDGQRVGFITGGRVVRVASLSGAPTVTLYDKANTTSGDWGPDGYVYFEVDSGIARVRASGGAVEPVYKISPQRQEVATEWINVLPGGKGVLFRVRHAGQATADFEVVAASIPQGTTHTLTRGVFARYVPTGHVLVVTADGKLIAIPFNLRRLELAGPPIALLEGVGVRNNGFNIDFTTAANGTVAYTTGGAAFRSVVWVNREGGITPVDNGWDPQGLIDCAYLSPDGKSVAVGLQRDGRFDIWIKRLPDGPFTRITFGDTSSVRPAWSPDGKDVFYIADHGGGAGSAYIHRADGTGVPRLMLPSKRDFGQIGPTPDGRWLLLRTSVDAGGNGDILGVKTGDTAVVPLVATPAGERTPAVSPDGRWLAYGSDESGSREVYVRPFPETASAKWQVSTAGGAEPSWAPNGRELFYIDGKGDMVAAEITPGAAFGVGRQRTLFSVTQLYRPGPIPMFSVAPDGQRFLMVRESASSQQSEMVLAENWLQTVQRQAGK
jgi:serine/threonine-protein kinase